MWRHGLLRLTKLTKLEGDELNGTLGVEGIPSQSMWRDNNISRCGGEFGDRVLEVLNAVLTSRSYNDHSISYVSMSCLCIDVVKLFHDAVDGEEATESSSTALNSMHIAVRRLYALCFARGTDAAKYTGRKCHFRIINCKIKVVVPPSVVVALIRGTGEDCFLPLPNSENICDNVLCFNTPVRGEWHLRAMKPFQLQDCGATEVCKRGLPKCM